MTKIKNISAIECLDSRGFPTLQVNVTCESGQSGSALVPSGASTGEFEALELRDGDKARYHGKGVLKALKNITEVLAPEIVGMDASDLRAIDEKMIKLDGSDSKTNLGANSILGISLATAKAAANCKQIPLFEFLAELAGNRDTSLLPVPLVNVINGGSHAENSIDFQEFMLVPHTANTFSDNIRACSEVFHTLKKNLVKKGMSVGLGDEGGFAPNLSSAEDAIKTLAEAIEDTGYSIGKDFSLALDVAASEFYDKEKNKYVLSKSTGDELNSEQMIELYASWIGKYPMVSIEDGLDENDWDGWSALNTKLGDKLQLVGDDLFVTNTKRLQKGIDAGSANSILIKLNQIGSVSETLDCIKLAHENNYTTVISHRSGETEDTTIADLAVATSAGQIKTGSVCRGERTAKYNRLLWIEHYLNAAGRYVSPFSK